jgi:hypothetical protein
MPFFLLAEGALTDMNKPSGSALSFLFPFVRVFFFKTAELSLYTILPGIPHLFTSIYPFAFILPYLFNRLILKTDSQGYFEGLFPLKMHCPCKLHSLPYFLRNLENTGTLQYSSAHEKQEVANECCNRGSHGAGIGDPDRYGEDSDRPQGRQDHDPREDDCLYQVARCAGH